VIQHRLPVIDGDEQPRDWRHQRALYRRAEAIGVAHAPA
jgi:hypothetical protein